MADCMGNLTRAKTYNKQKPLNSITSNSRLEPLNTFKTFILVI
jgi:hypothetical protein